jgi:arabinogalactan endo-1,4-beta-galactosidase
MNYEERKNNIAHTASMMKTVLNEGAVPLIVIAARPEDETTILVAWPGATNKAMANILESAVKEVRLTAEKHESN